MQTPKHILPVIVIAQFCCTSLWFAGNGVLPQLTETFLLPNTALSWLTSAVQFGFIVGTFVFALLTIADRFSPTRVFFICAILGAAANLCLLFENNTLESLVAFRFLTGVFLAGIYPVGMKIASDYYETGLGKSLGFLVAALVLGTAFPHALQNSEMSLSWKTVLVTISILSATGGLLLLLFVGDGPYRKPAQKLQLTTITNIFKNRSFRKAAFGYFGHMWELYAFWAFVPVLLKAYSLQAGSASLNISAASFFIISVGSLGCMAGGGISKYIGSEKVARASLLISGICCLLSPVFFAAQPILFYSFLLVWGMAVIADSPMFSTLVAQRAVSEQKGTALTIVNCIGFATTIVSIQVLSYLSELVAPTYLFLVLAIGPIFGLISMGRSKSKTVSA